jgi:hypothetical protein
MSTKRTAAVIDASNAARNAATNPSLEGIDVLDLTRVTGGSDDPSGPIVTTTVSINGSRPR